MIKERFETFKENHLYNEHKSEFDKFLNATDEQLESIEKLFPIPLDNYSVIEYSENDYLSIILASLDKLENLPNVFNFFGVLLDEEDRLHLLSVAEAKAIIENNNKEYKVAAINPNLNRVGKMLYGESVGNVTSELSDWFVDHLLDRHTNLYRKNVGQEYNTDKLSSKEKEASGDWLDDMFQEEINICFNLYLSIENPAVTNLEIVKRRLALYKMIDLIKVVEESKEDIQGYGFEGLPMEIPKEPTIEYIIKDLGNIEDEEFLFYYNKVQYNPEEYDGTHDVLKIAYDNCFIADLEKVLKSAIVYMSSVVMDEDKSLPEYELVRRIQSCNLSVNEIAERYKEAKKNPPIFIEVMKEVNRWQYHFCADIFIDRLDRFNYNIYDNILNNCNSYTKALIRKYNISTADILHFMISLVDIDSPMEIKYETSVVSAAQVIHGFNNPKIPNPYYLYFKKNKCSVKELLK